MASFVSRAAVVVFAFVPLPWKASMNSALSVALLLVLHGAGTRPPATQVPVPQCPGTPLSFAPSGLLARATKPAPALWSCRDQAIQVASGPVDVQAVGGACVALGVRSKGTIDVPALVRASGASLASERASTETKGTESTQLVCATQPSWTRRVGEPGTKVEVRALSAVEAPEFALLVGGRVSAPAPGAFVARYGPGGKPGFLSVLPTPEGETTALAHGPRGTTFAAGRFRESLTWKHAHGSHQLLRPKRDSMFLAHLDDQGFATWVATAVGASVLALETSATVGVRALGRFRDVAVFGTGPTALTLKASGESLFVAEYDADGKLLSARALGIDGRAALSSGWTLVASPARPEGDFEVPRRPGERPAKVTAPAGSIVLAEYGPEGSLLWSESVSDPEGAPLTIVDLAYQAGGAIELLATNPNQVARWFRYSELTLRRDPCPTNAVGLRDQATKAFRAKQFAAACEGFRKAVAACPSAPEYHADLGLCLARLGKTEEAVAANQRAILEATGPLPYQGDPEVRSNAYFNLAQLGVNLVALSNDERCVRVTPAPGCATPLFACLSRWGSGGSHQSSWTTMLWFALTEEEARYEDGSVEPPHRGEHVAGLKLVTEDQIYGSGLSPEDARLAGTRKCTVVWADACHGMVGAWCTAEGWDRPPENSAEEAGGSWPSARPSR